jgi:uncharacterized protein
MNTKPQTQADWNDDNANTSDNASFEQVLHARTSRRVVLSSGAATALTAAVGGLPLLAACGGSDDDAVVSATQPLDKLGFVAVAKNLNDVVTVPAGYTASVIYALGDPLTSNTPAFRNDGTDDSYDRRAGDHHDGMEWFGLAANGTASAEASERGLLAMNHEATTDETLSSFFLHASGGTSTLPRPAAEVDKELMIHGVSVVEMTKSASGAWAAVPGSSFNRRITTLTEVDIAGPARGHALLKTRYSPNGTVTRGTLNNCGCGKSPWGTYLTGEENWFGYFTRPTTDDTARGNDKSVVALRRYGRNAGAASRHGWETAGTADIYARWINARTGTSTDGTDDYRNELNGMGYIVEVDPYNPQSRAQKRTALGRFAHESAVFSLPRAGEKLAAYMGDDSRGEYMYKFVSDAVWSDADANPANRIATGAKYLDNGKLYVAIFAANGTGTWRELSVANIPSTYTAYAFADEADVRINARLAADAVGATRMDRPEWCAVHPTTGEIYYTLTNNSNRRVAPGTGQIAVDPANPRGYADARGTTTQSGNVNGHIIRIKEGTGNAAATSFTWDVYLFGAQADADPNLVNLSSLKAEQDFSSPDGLAFSKSTGICWIQTDDGAYTDVTNCMMLASIPGTVGDGAKKTLVHSPTVSVDTYVGKAPTADTLKRFLVGPKGSEITGLTETPDGKTLFVNIQHPGEGTAMADVGDPTKYQSQWPSSAGYGAGKRPRSATIAITKNDGGRIGS